MSKTSDSVEQLNVGDRVTVSTNFPRPALFVGTVVTTAPHRDVPELYVYVRPLQKNSIMKRRVLSDEQLAISVPGFDGWVPRSWCTKVAPAPGSAGGDVFGEDENRQDEPLRPRPKSRYQPPGAASGGNGVIQQQQQQPEQVSRARSRSYSRPANRAGDEDYEDEKHGDEEEEPEPFGGAGAGTAAGGMTLTLRSLSGYRERSYSVASSRDGNGDDDDEHERRLQELNDEDEGSSGIDLDVEEEYCDDENDENPYAAERHTTVSDNEDGSTSGGGDDADETIISNPKPQDGQGQEQEQQQQIQQQKKKTGTVAATTARKTRRAGVAAAERDADYPVSMFYMGFEMCKLLKTAWAAVLDFAPPTFVPAADNKPSSTEDNMTNGNTGAASLGNNLLRDANDDKNTQAQNTTSTLYSVHLCHRCLAPLPSRALLQNHFHICSATSLPPTADTFYSSASGDLTVYRIDALLEPEFGQRMAILGRCFIETKDLWDTPLQDVEFFVMYCSAQRLGLASEVGGGGGSATTSSNSMISTNYRAGPGLPPVVASTADRTFDPRWMPDRMRPVNEASAKAAARNLVAAGGSSSTDGGSQQQQQQGVGGGGPKSPMDNFNTLRDRKRLKEQAARAAQREEPQPLFFAGYFSRVKNTNNQCLSCIMVLPPFQGRGLGTVLMKLAYALDAVRLRECGCELLCGTEPGKVEQPWSHAAKGLLRSHLCEKVCLGVKRIMDDDALAARRASAPKNLTTSKIFGSSFATSLGGGAAAGSTGGGLRGSLFSANPFDDGNNALAASTARAVMQEAGLTTRGGTGGVCAFDLGGDDSNSRGAGVESSRAGAGTIGNAACTFDSLSFGEDPDERRKRKEARRRQREEEKQQQPQQRASVSSARGNRAGGSSSGSSNTDIKSSSSSRGTSPSDSTLDAFKNSPISPYCLTSRKGPKPWKSVVNQLAPTMNPNDVFELLREQKMLATFLVRNTAEQVSVPDATVGAVLVPRMVLESGNRSKQVQEQGNTDPRIRPQTVADFVARETKEITDPLAANLQVNFPFHS